MNISVIISISSLILAVANFFYAYKNNKRNKTIDDFYKLRTTTLDRFDEITIKDIDATYSKNKKSSTSKAEIRCLMAELEMFCQFSR